MNKNQIGPPVKKAIEYLRSHIQGDTWKGSGNTMPPIKALAAEAEIGYLSMIAAIKILQKEKVIYSTRSQGTFVGQPQKKNFLPRSSREPVLKWQIIRDKIKYDILEGRFIEREFLPDFKELEAIYTTSYPVLKRAIESLVNVSLITSEKRRHRIRRYKATSALNTICFISNQRNFSLSLWLSMRTWLELFVRSLEKECLVRKIRLTRTIFSKTLDFSIGTGNVLGYIFWYYDYDSLDDKKCIEIVKSLIPQKKPITIFISSLMTFEEETVAQLVELAKKHPHIYLVQFPHNFNAGLNVGRFLIDHGYTKAAYFYPDFGPWSKDRYYGLSEVFNSMGISDGAIAFPISQDNLNDVSPLSAISRDTVLTNDMNTKFNLLDSFRGPLIKENGRSSFCEIEDRFITQIYETQNGIAFRRAFQLKFREALKIKERIAWVCADDYIANYAALQFLKDEQIKIPGNIGLIGFNDQIESLINGVTSYNFNLTGMALRALNFILYPNDKQWKKDRKDSVIVLIKGMVIDRGSA